MTCGPTFSGVAVWNSGLFLARYPEFTTSYNNNSGLYESLFVEAGFYLSNCPTSPVQNVPKRLLLLNMLVAHIAFLGGALNADGQARPVGRISSAGEGSVNASFEFAPPTPGTAAWFNQSQYGAAFWAATSNLRSIRYSAGCNPPWRIPR